MKKPYAIITHTAKSGIGVVHIRSSQAEAHELAADIAVEAVNRINDLAMFRHSIISTLETDGVVTAFNEKVKSGTTLYEITVQQISTTDDFSGPVLTEPLTMPLMREMVKGKDDSYIEGVVVVELADMIDNDLDAYLDIISEKLCDSSLTGANLMEVDYWVVGHLGETTLLMKVSGDASQILADEDDGGEAEADTGD
jgi:hypothetical protein